MIMPAKLTLTNIAFDKKHGFPILKSNFKFKRFALKLGRGGDQDYRFREVGPEVGIDWSRSGLIKGVHGKFSR
jgi:hypothetical protein